VPIDDATGTEVSRQQRRGVRIAAESTESTYGNVVDIAPGPDGDVLVIWTGGIAQRFDEDLVAISTGDEITSDLGCCAQAVHVDESGTTYLVLTTPSRVLDGHGEAEPAPVVVTFDPTSGATSLVHAFEQPPYVGHVASARGGVIVASGGIVLRIDPTSGAETARHELDEPAGQLSTSGGVVLVTTGRAAHLLDAVTLVPIGTVQGDGILYGVASGGKAWITRGHELFWFEPGSAPVSVDLELPVRQVVASEEHLWLVLSSSIVVLDARSSEVIGRMPLGPGLVAPIAARGDSMWAQRVDDRIIVRYELEAASG
jgi:hypothetical protein